MKKKKLPETILLTSPTLSVERMEEMLINGEIDRTQFGLDDCIGIQRIPIDPTDEEALKAYPETGHKLLKAILEQNTLCGGDDIIIVDYNEEEVFLYAKLYAALFSKNRIIRRVILGDDYK